MENNKIKNKIPSTVEYYNKNADHFMDETVAVNFTEIQKIFLNLLPHGGKILDKTTPRLIQFHTLKNAVNPPFLGGFSIFNTVVA